MSGDDSLTKIVLAVLVVLFVAFAGLGFYFMTQVGAPDKPDTLEAKLDQSKNAVKRLLWCRNCKQPGPCQCERPSYEGEIADLEKAVAEIEKGRKGEGGKKEKEGLEDVAWDIEMEKAQLERLRSSRSAHQYMRDFREKYYKAIDQIRNQIASYLENGSPEEIEGGYGYQPLTRRKDKQEQDNAQTISRLDSAIDEAKNELTKANNRYARRYEDKRNLRSRLETELDQTKDELQKASQREPADVDVSYDGVVLTVNVETRQAVISIGEEQGVKRGMRFEVFQVRRGGRRAHKGYLVVRSTGRETANCIILEQAVNLGRCPSCGYTARLPEETNCPYCTGSGQGLHIQRLSASPRAAVIGMTPDDPIVAGDLVQNPFLEPGKQLRIAVKGDPLHPSYKTEDLIAAVRWHGGIVDAEVGAGTDILLAGKWATEETRRARELGIRVLHHFEVFDFLRK